MILRAVVFGLFGLLLGSFLTVVVHRVPLKASVGKGRSRCPSCGAQIAARDNVPLLSYLLLRGRCRSCGARISPRYPLTELATAALFVAASIRFPATPVAVMMAAFFWVLLSVALIDLGHRIIPNRIVYPSLIAFALTLVALRLAGYGPDLPGAGLGFLVFGGALLLVALISPRGMGMGDVKLAALIGLVLGAFTLAWVVVAAFAAVFLGGMGGAVAAVVLRRGRKGTIPFGPYLSLGGVIAALAGQAIADWYLRLFR